MSKPYSWNREQVRLAKDLIVSFLSSHGPSSAERINDFLAKNGIDRRHAGTARLGLMLSHTIGSRHIKGQDEEYFIEGEPEA